MCKRGRILIRHDINARTIGITNERVELILGYSGPITVDRLSAPGAIASVLGDAEPSLFQLTVSGNPLDPATISDISVETAETRGGDLVAIRFSHDHDLGRIEGRVSIFEKSNSLIEWVIQLASEWRVEAPAATTIAFPFLGVAARHPHYYRPGHARSKTGTADFSRYDFQEFPPAILSDVSTGWAVGFGFFGEFPLHYTNSNFKIWQATGADDPGTHEIYIRPTRQLQEIMSMKILASEGGRSGIFELWKHEVRSRYDLRRYKLPGPKWYLRSYLQHFTYAYGREAYDYDRGVIDIKGLLDRGEEFGGYDALIYWHQYPRLGLDSRTQWEMYTDLPDGLKSLRKIADICHKRGVRFFLPFKPWDVHPSESMDDQAVEIERLVEQIGVDGFFLDTMGKTPPSFSALIRDRFPELMFCTEGRPAKLREIQELTASWDQVKQPTFVESNLFRFVFPEHPKNTTARWSVGVDKDRLIQRAVFNGCGLVIWQDVFGEWLPFSTEQKEAIRAWKAVLKEHHDTIFGPRSVPFVDTCVPGLIANRFAAEPEKNQIVVLYNSTAEPITGRLVLLSEVTDAKVRLVWGGSTDVRGRASPNGGTIVSGSIAQSDVVAIHVST